MPPLQSQPTNIPVPQTGVANYQFQQPDMAGIAAIYNRPKPGEIAASQLSGGIDQALNAYYKQKELQASAFGQGGPYLMNLLYGNGQQASNTPPGQVAGQMPQTDNSPGQGQVGGQSGVGGPSPSNGAATPATSAQTLAPNNVPQGTNQPQQPGQPLMHPTSGLPQTIHDSANGVYSQMPDFSGHLAKIRSLQGQMDQSNSMFGASQYGQRNQQMLGGQMAAEKAAMDAEQAPTQFAKTQQDLANAQQEIPKEQRSTIAGEVSKQSQDSQQIRDLQVLTNNLQKSLPNNLGVTGNISGKVYQATGGRLGSAQAANMENSTIPLATGLNTVLSHRFNAGEVAALGQSLIPQPKDTPAYQQQKLQNLNNLLGVMAQGNEQNVRNVAAAITNGAIPKIQASIPNEPTQNTAPQGKAISISSKSQYDGLANGTPFTWNGQQHIKGKY